MTVPVAQEKSGRVLTYLWVTLVTAVAVAWFAAPEWFDADTWSARLAEFGAWAWAIFIVVSLVRGLLLIPSTPVILTGAALFPGAPGAVFLISMVGICLSAVLLYRFPGFAGYDSRLAAKYPEQLGQLRAQLTKPRAMWFVAAWAFFPAVPTDLICYAAGLVRMPLHRLMFGIILGEVPLVLAYVVLGNRVVSLWPF
jgi:uncharacterized membrane protein YdjX (TVP38/TMEM64 family)